VEGVSHKLTPFIASIMQHIIKQLKAMYRNIMIIMNDCLVIISPELIF